jgi:hypothetical protein
LGFESLPSRVLLAADTFQLAVAEGEGETHVVQQSGPLVFVLGDATDNQVEVELGAERHQIRVDGTDYSFDASEVNEILIDGNSGNDEVSVLGSQASERVDLQGNKIKLASPDGLVVRIESFENIDLNAGAGNDRAKIVDTAGDDLLSYGMDRTEFRTDEATISFVGFEQIEALASQGGDDSVEFHDSVNDDRFVTSEAMASMIGQGFRHSATAFEVVDAFYTSGGSDEVHLTGSAGDDHLVTRPDMVVLNTDTAEYRAHNFPTYRVTAADGVDTAEMFGSIDTQTTFFGQPETAFMRSLGDRIEGNPNSLWPGSTSEAVSSVHVLGFDRIEAFAVSGSGRAELMGDAGIDRYVAFPNLAELRTASGATIEVNNFQVVRTFGNGGKDRATLLDSPGDDRFIGRRAYSYLRDEQVSYFNFVAGFTVDVISTSGRDFGEVAEFGDGDERGEGFLVANGPDFMSIRRDAVGERVIGFARGSSRANGIGSEVDSGLLILEGFDLPDGFCLCGDHSNAIFPSQEVSDAIVQRSEEAVGNYEIQDGDIVLLNSDVTNFGGA